MAKNFWENDKIVQPAKSSKTPWENDSIVQPFLAPPPPYAEETFLTPEERMVASTGEASGTGLSDVGKLASASAVKSIFGAPEAVQAAGSGLSRDLAFKPTEALNFLADPRQLTNQLASYIGAKPIFEQDKNAILGKDLVNKQRVALDEALTKGKIQSLREVTKYGSEISKMIEDTVSPEMKEALANTEPTGNVLKALDQKVFGVAAGDTEISFGKAPSAQGLIGQAARVFGSAAPGILTSFITKSATPATVFGFGQAGGEAVETAREHISRMSDTQLAKDSEYYRNLLVLGYPPKEARAMTEEKAADTAAYYQGIVGALGGAFTGNLVAGKFDSTKLLNARNVLTRISKGTAVGMVEEGAQELAEGIATDLGINRTVVREMGVDSFANAVLGAIGGGGPGAVSGALSKPKEPPPPPPPPGTVPPAAAGQIPPTVPPAAPPAVPPAKMAEITADEIEEDTPIKKGVTGVTPPAGTLNPELKARAIMRFEQLVMDATETGQVNTRELNKLARELDIKPSKNMQETSAAISKLLFQTPTTVTPPADVTAPIKSSLTEDDILNEKRSLYSYLIETAGRPQDVAAKTMTTWQDKANESSQPQNVWESENGAIGVVASNQKAPFKNAKLLGTVYPEGYSGPAAGQAKETPPADVTPPAPALTKFNVPIIGEGETPTGEIDEVDLDPNTLYFEDGAVYALGTKFDHPLDNFIDDLPDSPTKQALIDASNKLIEDNTKPTEEAPKTELQKVMEKEEKLESPTISKKSVIPHATVYVAPYKDGFVSSFQYYGGGKSQLNISTPLDLEKIFPTRQRAIDYAAFEIRRRAEKDKNKVALTWLDTVSTPAAPKKTQAEINKERQAEKKAAAEKAKQPVDTSGVKDLIEGKIKKVLGWTVYKRKEDPDFWYVQSPENHAANRIGQGDDVSTNLDTARSRIEQHIADAEYDAKKAAAKQEEKPKEIPAGPKETKLKHDDIEYANTPRIRSLIEKAEGIQSNLPPVQEGMIRLYRGNRKGEVGQNPSFTNSLVGIALPFQESYGGSLSYVDIPKADLAKYESTTASALGSEFSLPKEIAKQAKEIKADFVVDDEGEKIDSPLFVDMAEKGYKVLGFDNPRSYTDKGGTTFRTIEKDGVRLALEPRKLLFKQQGKEYGRVQYGIGQEKDVTFEHLQVDPSKRKQGLAKQAIQDLIDVADKNGYTLYLEPAQLEDQGMTKEQLSALYSKYGFVATNESGNPMEREPGAKAVPVEVKKTQAEINRERQAEKKNKVEEKKPSTDIVPKVDESWASHRKDVLTEKPFYMPQEVWEKYQDLQKGNFSFDKVSFTGANALARANAANKERKKVYEKAVQEFLNYPITAKAPTKNQPKIEVGSVMGTFAPPIAKNIKVAKTLDEQKKALLTLAAPKNELRVYLQGVLVEPNQLVVTDGHRLAVYKTNTGVAEKTLLDKDGKLIDMQYAPYDRVLDKTKNAKSYGMVNATALGNYVRGISKAWKYVSASKQVPFSFQLKNGDKPIHFNGTYIEDMANVFRQFGYEGFEIQYNDGGMLVAKSPDSKLTQIVMGTRDDSLLFQPFNVQEKRPGIFRTAEEEAKFRKELGLSEESRTIDVEATEITEEQIMLLSDETDKLSKKEMDTLEQYYGFDRDSKDFFAMLREDVIRYVNKGANAVDETIRSIIAKLQAGVLAVAIVFNPTYMSESSAVVFPSKPGIEQVRAAVPESAKDMSEGAKKAYATLYPALQEGLESKDKLFTIVDKPTSKIYVFNPDGSLLVKDNVLLGKALGDTYVGQTEFKENRMTPAGLIKVKAEKGSATYDGKTIYTFGNVKEGWRAAFIHTVYLKESDAEARKKALETGKDTRMSYGCINAKPELMAKIAENNRMDESHVFVVPDNQEMIDEYIANTVPNEDLTRETVTPVTKTTQAPTKGSKSIGTVDLLGREEEAIISRTQAEINKERQAAKLAAQKVVDDGPFFNNFEADFTKKDLDESIVETRKEKIKEQAGLSRKITGLTKKVADVGSTLDIQSKLNRLLEDRKLIKDEIADTKQERRSADWFRARAAEGKAKGELSAEAMAVVDVLYAKYPNVLENLKLSIRQRAQLGVAGNFSPLSRLVTIYHSSLSSVFDGTSGEKQAVTMRHEIAHSLEQMMTPEQQMALVEAWGDAFAKVIKANPGPAEQKFFHAVLDFVERPNEENFDKATSLMPSYDFYQYMNPSEFWAVNAEKLMKAQLGTPWARFVKSVQKLWEAIKSVFGFNNRYAVHREFDRIMSGDQQVMTKKMLASYVARNNKDLKFLRNIEKIAEENENVPEVPDNDPKSFKEMMIGTYGRVVENAANIAKNPKDNSLKALDKASEGILYTRIKNFWFGAGLEARDFAKYNGAIRTADNMAVASLAVKNVIHAGSISTQVLLQGALEYSTDFMQFIAVKRDYSMKNVAKLQYDIRKKLGRKEGDKTIQAYLVASRSRGIYNTYVEAQAKLEMAIDNFDDAARAGDEEGRTKAYNEMQEADRALEQAIIAYQKIPTYLRQLNEKGETIYETVEDRKGNEYKLPVLNDEQIDIFINRENKYPELAKILENFTAVNHEMIDNMVKGSRISLREGERLKKMKGYVPWNRVMDEQEDLFDNRKIPSMPSNIKYFKKGETEREIGNIIENMNHNVTMMTRSAIRNYAQVRIVQEYARRKENGKLQLFPSEGRFESGVRVPVFIAGQRRIVEIPDAMVAEAILGMITPPYEIPMQKLLGAAAQLVRRTVTFSAYFQLKQVFYDAPTAAWVSGVKNPLAVWTGAFSGFVKAVNPFSNDPIVEIMRSAGIGGFQSYHRTPKKEQDIEFGMVKRSAFAYALKVIDHIGDSSDYAQRIATYNQVFKETGDKALALMQAADVIDFQKHGNGRLAQALRVSVTFMQAYATQLDVLTQAMVGGNLKGQSRVDAAIKFHLTGVAMGSLMVLWAAMSCGDDDYHELDDDVKARNLYVPHSKKIFGKHILIPLRSTAAMFYKVMPELIYYDLSQKGTKNEMDRTRFWNASGNAAVDMLLGPTPIPSAFKGVIEISLDRNFYTGGDITPDYLKKLEATRQYTASTSELGKIFSAATQIPFTAKEGKENKRVLSPIQADHLMRSLGGSLATVSMYFTNMVFNSDRPSTQLKENPLLGGLVGADVARRNESLFYDLKERSDKVYGTFQDLIKNDRKRGIEYRKENIKMIQAYGYTSAMAQNLSTMNQQIRRLSRSEDLTVEEKAMTPEQKRERINFFNQKKQDILKDVIERRKMAGL